MSTTDDILKANEEYVRNFNLSHLTIPTARRLVIVACMDARLAVEQLAGLKTGDAHIIRNAGGVVTDDVIRSLLISHYLLGTNEWIIVEHTECGMLTFKDEELLSRLENETGVVAHAPSNTRPSQRMFFRSPRLVPAMRSRSRPFARGYSTRRLRVSPAPSRGRPRCSSSTGSARRQGA